MKEADRRTAEGILFTDQYQLTMGQVYLSLVLLRPNLDTSF